MIFSKQGWLGGVEVYIWGIPCYNSGALICQYRGVRAAPLVLIAIIHEMLRVGSTPSSWGLAHWESAPGLQFVIPLGATQSVTPELVSYYSPSGISRLCKAYLHDKFGLKLIDRVLDFLQVPWLDSTHRTSQTDDGYRAYVAPAAVRCWIQSQNQ